MGGLEDLIKKGLGLISGEAIVADALRALVVEEIKDQIKSRIVADPEKREMLREAAKEYLEAKTREQLAVMKAAKVILESAVELVPKDLSEEITNELAGLIEEYVRKVAERLE